MYLCPSRDHLNIMKKTIICGATLLALLSMASCKPNQQATKEAYEKAMAAAVEKPIVTEETPVEDAITEVQPIVTQRPATERTEHVNVLDDGKMNTYNIVVGSYKQRTNAYSQRDRLREDGYPALVAQNAEGWYRVIACSFATREEANEARYKITQRYPESYIKDPWFLIRR